MHRKAPVKLGSSFDARGYDEIAIPRVRGIDTSPVNALNQSCHSSLPPSRAQAGVLPFMVLIERRAQPLRQRLLAALLLATMVLSALLGFGPAQAQTAQDKVALDLRNVIASPTTPQLNWVKDLSGQRYVKALIVSNSSDPDLVALRGAVMSAGGSVYLRFVSVRALSVMMPASQVYNLAARSDVQGISPNRLTARTASHLEFATGTMNQRTYSGANWTGLDGRGIGVAVLDSGILEQHKNMMAADGKTTRVKRAVNFQRVGDATALGVKDWTPGIDSSASLYPGSKTMASYESNISYLDINRPDEYGHGTHVASVAAGRGAYQVNDSSGIAPGADLYDV